MIQFLLNLILVRAERILSLGLGQMHTAFFFNLWIQIHGRFKDMKLKCYCLGPTSCGHSKSMIFTAKGKSNE